MSLIVSWFEWLFPTASTILGGPKSLGVKAWLVEECHSRQAFGSYIHPHSHSPVYSPLPDCCDVHCLSHTHSLSWPDTTFPIIVNWAEQHWLHHCYVLRWTTFTSPSLRIEIDNIGFTIIINWDGPLDLPIIMNWYQKFIRNKPKIKSFLIK